MFQYLKNTCPLFFDTASIVFFAVFLLSFWLTHPSPNQSSVRLSAAGFWYLRLFLLMVCARFIYFESPKFLEQRRWLLAFACLLFVAMFLTKWFQHASFNTHAEDIGRFHSVLWNTLHGRFMTDSLTAKIYFSDHLMFFMFFFVPFYWIYSGVEMLFFLTAVAYAAAAVAIYWLSLERLKKPSLALLMSGVFIFHRYVWGAFLHEFHPDFYAPVFFILLFVAFFKNRVKSFFLLLLLILIMKEDYAIYLVPVGIYFALQKNGRWMGVVAIVVSGLYALAAFSTILPHFYQMAGKSSAYTYINSWSNVGDGFGGILQSLVTRPAHVLSEISLRPLLNFASKFLFLPLLSPATLIFLLPVLFVHLSSVHPLIRGLSIHYGLVPSALALIACIEGLRNLQALLKGKQTWAVPAILAALLVTGTFRFYSFIPMGEAKILRSQWSELETKQPLCVQSSVYPHVSLRGDLSVFPECSSQARFLLLNETADPYPLNREEFLGKVSDLMKSVNWKVLERRGNLILFEKRQNV